MNTVEQVSKMDTELQHLRAKSEADDSMIALLKQQNEVQAIEIATMSAKHAEEIRELRQRHDKAVRNEMEIEGILVTAAQGIMTGLRKRKGDDEPADATAEQERREMTPAQRVLNESMPSLSAAHDRVDMDQLAGALSVTPAHIPIRGSRRARAG